MHGFSKKTTVKTPYLKGAKGFNSKFDTLLFEKEDGSANFFFEN